MRNKLAILAIVKCIANGDVPTTIEADVRWLLNNYGENEAMDNAILKRYGL